ncbi:MAG: hypothetical protein HON76_18210 [Candidatus Scalindua sp.]|nr:hypothetical protein [Candidatus Scalindua sp.]MBT6231066.1 hypothetical protein [Candidatus Scalindua sp.]MBT6564456.1 hypothetical protein [Candidatus Scalindua sp.]
MSSDISGPFKTSSGPPYVYEVSFYSGINENDLKFTDGKDWLSTLKHHALDLDIQFKSKKTANGYELAFIKNHDYETLLKSIDAEVRESFECRTNRIRRYMKLAPYNSTPSVDKT